MLPDDNNVLKGCFPLQQRMDCDMSLSVDNTSSSSVQHDRISSSSDMDGTEPPIKKSKIVKDNDIEDSQSLKENGNF